MNQLKIISTTLFAVMVIAITVGCVVSDDNIENLEYKYLSSVISMPMLPSWTLGINHIAISNEHVFFNAKINTDEKVKSDNNDLSEAYYGADAFYRMNFDGSGLIELPIQSLYNIPEYADYGYAGIVYLYVDFEDNLWTIELCSYTATVENYINYFIRKLDNTGNQILEIDITNHSISDEYFYVSSFCIDKSGNIYFTAGQILYIYSQNGDFLFTLDTQSTWNPQLVLLSSGSVAYYSRQMDEAFIVEIDINEQGKGDSILIPFEAFSIFSGDDEYIAYFNNGSDLFGIDTETNDFVYIFNWLDNGIVPSTIKDFITQNDGSIYAATQTGFNRFGDRSTELVKITRKPFLEAPEITVLTLGTIFPCEIIEYAVVQYNRLSTSHKIHVIDYTKYNTSRESAEGYTRMSLDIASGNGQDILDLKFLSLNNLIARDMLVNLYPLLDEDSFLNRNDIIGNLLNEDELSGNLYHVIPAFSINTIIGSPSVLGDERGWNIYEFNKILDTVSRNQVSLEATISKVRFLELSVIHSIEDYYNRATQKTDFDNVNFINLLEYSNTFPSEIDRWAYLEEIPRRNQIMLVADYYSLIHYIYDRSLFGREAVIKGFPVENREGHLINPARNFGITNRCKDVDGAWEFLSFLLTEHFQRNYILNDLPSNKIVFKEYIEEAKIYNFGWYWQVDSTLEEGGKWIENVPPLTEDEAEIILHIAETAKINTVDKTLLNIIKETASDYFNGRMSAQDAAKIIQSRASIYMSEQG